MAQNVRDSFLDLEKHRQLLEENIEKLRKSLRHWQLWEAEYEGLKEEILAADPTPNRKQLVALAHEYEGELVSRKEVDEILGTGTRDASQVVNILDRRIDYVEQNVRTVQKQIEAAENKLAAATIISTPEVRNEDGLPLTEIMEELDEDGNVISSHTTTPGSAKPQLLEVLKKAGVDVPQTSESESTSHPASKPASDKIDKNSAANESEKRNASQGTANSTKKGVKFSEDTKSGPEITTSNTAKRLEGIMKQAKQSEAKPTEAPVIPTDEPADDAALRREMLQYGLDEVGSVVAELNLEEGSDWSDEDYEDDDSNTDDEDEFGRSKGRMVDEDLRQRMIELEERLGVRMMENIGNKASDYDVVQEGIGRVTITGGPDISSKQEPQKASDADKNTKKSVRFSEDIDVSPPPQPATNSQSRVTELPLSAPISDIVERTAPGESNGPAPKKKVSRFKAEKAATVPPANGPLALPNGSPSGPSLSLQPAKPSQPKPFSQPIAFSPAHEERRIAPTGPEGQTLAPAIVERDVPLDSVQEPDDLEPHLVHQEVATEYHKMRNKMIQRQGGFAKEDESEIVPFTEEEGGPKKMSRFKAARLARS
jgi:unconventional prefoldin RPB5 interactor 1